MKEDRDEENENEKVKSKKKIKMKKKIKKIQKEAKNIIIIKNLKIKNLNQNSNQDRIQIKDVKKNIRDLVLVLYKILYMYRCCMELTGLIFQQIGINMFWNPEYRIKKTRRIWHMGYVSVCLVMIGVLLPKSYIYTDVAIKRRIDLEKKRLIRESSKGYRSYVYSCS